MKQPRDEPARTADQPRLSAPGPTIPGPDAPAGTDDALAPGGAVPLSRVRLVEDRLRRDGQVRVRELSRDLAVSEMTIRRDLSALEQSGIARRSHGGAVLVDPSFSDPGFVDRRQQQRVAKVQIARYCAELLPEGSSIFVGGGTTTCEVVRMIRDRPDLSIFTSNLAAASQAKTGGTKMFVLGGAVQGLTCALVGELARASISLLWADLAILGADAISATAGLTSHSPEEAAVARMMAERCRGDVICVADSTKWDAAADWVVLPPGKISRIITDAVPAPQRQRLEQLGVRVDTV